MENDGDKMKLKSRLLAKGFEEDYDEEILKNSTTITKSSLRTELSVIVQYNGSVNTYDIKTAFLLDVKIEQNVYIRSPSKIYAKKILKLRKCISALADGLLQ